jgi:HK97 family phage prohead protease
MNRAFALLDVKSFAQAGDVVTVEGIASTPTADRMDDIVEPMGARFKTPMPFMLHHDASLPVGNVTFARPTEKGIPFEAKIPIIKEAGRLKERIDEAIHSLKYNLVRAVSIGFSIIKHEVIKATGGYDITEWEWLELSLVTIPANHEAVITAVKSLDISTEPADIAPTIPAAKGKKDGPVKINRSGDPDKKPTYVKLTKP